MDDSGQVRGRATSIEFEAFNREDQCGAWQFADSVPPSPHCRASDPESRGIAEGGSGFGIGHSRSLFQVLEEVGELILQFRRLRWLPRPCVEINNLAPRCHLRLTHFGPLFG